MSAAEGQAKDGQATDRQTKDGQITARQITARQITDLKTAGYLELHEFATKLDYALDPFQVEACKALESGRSVLVAAPTGSGKTTVAEFAIWLAMSRQARVVYTAPIKALSNQKFNELKAYYGDDQVGLLTGDTNIRAGAPILVMTTEVLRNMIYERSSTLDDLTHVILDEVHYLADRFRGAVWEEIILHLPNRIKLVSLSATVSNAEEFGQWLHTVRGQTEVIVSERRPVPLYQHVFTKNQIMPLFVDKDGELQERGRLNRDLVRLERNAAHAERARYGNGNFAGRNERGKNRRPKRNRVNYRELVTELEHHRLLPAINFVFSRRGCDDAVRQCVYDGVRLTTRQEREEIRRVAHEHLKAISKEDLYALGYNHWLQALEHGVAAHHAGLIPPFKTVIETLFQRRLLKLVFATETLALGINMPAKSVVIEQLEKFNGQEVVPLAPGEFTQLTGRAGRRGIDTEGHAIIVWQHRQDLDQLATLASKRVYPLKSSFKPTYNMAVNLLERSDLAMARATLERSFAQFQADREMVSVAEEIRSEQASIAGYREAASRTSGADKKKWQARAQKLEQSLKRKLRLLERRTGVIARVFERLVQVLADLGYVTGDEQNPKPTWQGEMLRGIYGERDLLVAECLRQQVWAELNPTELAAMVASLVYEPRRDDEYATTVLPGGNFREAFHKTLGVWMHLDDREEEARLQRQEAPHGGLARAMVRWARADKLENVLDLAGMGPGDFIRTTKQTVDLLDQLHRLKDVPEPQTAGDAELHKHVLHIAGTARAARDLISRGIVEAASVTA